MSRASFFVASLDFFQYYGIELTSDFLLARLVSQKQVWLLNSSAEQAISITKYRISLMRSAHLPAGMAIILKYEAFEAD